MPSPCGGCPPCCAECVFDTSPQDTKKHAVITIQSATDYGCVKGYGDIVLANQRLGQMRNGQFHPATPAGMQFLTESKNSLAQYS